MLYINILIFSESEEAVEADEDAYGEWEEKYEEIEEVEERLEELRKQHNQGELKGCDRTHSLSYA